MLLAALLAGSQAMAQSAPTGVRIKGSVYGGGNDADVLGNATVKMEAGYVGNRIFGGGNLGSIGTITTRAALSSDHNNITHNDCLRGKPTAFQDGTGVCRVTVSGGQVGPTGMKMPEDFGYVFGACRGALEDPQIDPDIEFKAYVKETHVTINETTGSTLIVGGVYGGSENGRVLTDTYVTIAGGQIGVGAGKSEKYAEQAFINPLTTTVTTDNALAECASWEYKSPYQPYDPNSNPTGTDGHTFYGNVFGGGSGFFPYKKKKTNPEDADEWAWLESAGLVEGNTHLTISGGHILTSAYGGNELTNVTGTCYVTMSGGTLGVPRTIEQIRSHPVTCYLFGAGKGDQRTLFNQSTNVGAVEMNITGGTIYGSIFGGGEDGHVLGDVTIDISETDGIKSPTIIGTWGTSYVDGNVFGGGRGFGGGSLTAGVVSGNVAINIKGGTMLGSIYGGGRLGSVGTYLVPTNDSRYGTLIPDGKQQVIGGADVDASGVTHGNITINISGGTIGNTTEYNPSANRTNMPLTEFDTTGKLVRTKGGNVFTGCMGRLYALDGTTIIPHWFNLGKARKTTLNITGGHIKSSVYGGSELGTLEGDATITITGGRVGSTVTTATGSYNFGSVFGGGKGSTVTLPTDNDGDDDVEYGDIADAGKVGGNVLIKLNEGIADDAKGGIVHHIFGCNDMNGSPKGTVKVYVYATQNVEAERIANTAEQVTPEVTNAKVKGRYDVEAVYGGGNMASYVPAVLTNAQTEVFIEGCQQTSIEYVYGGGNAASTPATHILVKSCYEIGTLFAGGNGKDILPDGTANPGANVGYTAFTIPAEATTEQITEIKADASYGPGTTLAELYGGTIHKAYGGSNTKGNIRENATVKLDNQDDTCPLCVEEVYGAGNEADQDGSSEIQLGCVDYLEEIYGGARNADVNKDVVLNIQSGRFKRVFGGNNLGGRINGTITVNIEETGCHPIIIGQLYGGGNQARYETPSGKPGPTINVKSFTSIGEIYGGGYGESAVVVGDTHVNINECVGENAEIEMKEDPNDVSENTGEDVVITTKPAVAANPEADPPVVAQPAETVTIHQPEHKKGAIGAIGNVYGGGNAAEVQGSTYVNIGTVDTVTYETMYETEEVEVTDDEGTKTETVIKTDTDGNPIKKVNTVTGVDIRGNVYGGGNAATVTGNTNVVVGK